MSATLRVKRSIKYNIPIIFDWIVPFSWLAITADGVDITSELSKTDILMVFSHDWDYFDLELDIEVEGDVQAGRPEFFCKHLGAWNPPEGAEVNWKALLGKIDVTGCFEVEEADRIEDKFYKQWEKENG